MQRAQNTKRKGAFEYYCACVSTHEELPVGGSSLVPSGIEGSNYGSWAWQQPS